MSQLKSHLPKFVHEIALRTRLAKWDSARFVRRQMPSIPSVRGREELLDWCLSTVTGADPDGLFLEFGVGKGNSLRRLAQCRRTYGFDCFDGLPQEWRRGFPVGMFAVTPDELDEVRSIPNAELIVGLFEDTLPAFLAGIPAAQRRISLVHVDCDLYSSTVTILDNVRPYLNPGALIIFDEYFNFPSWRQHEHRALVTWKDAPDWEYACYATQGEQVAIRVK